MPVFPERWVDEAEAQGMRVSPFAWGDDLPGREATSGTAVVGDPEQLERFLHRFVAANISEGVRSLVATPDRQTAESVIYFPDWHLQAG